MGRSRSWYLLMSELDRLSTTPLQDSQGSMFESGKDREHDASEFFGWLGSDKVWLSFISLRGAQDGVTKTLKNLEALETRIVETSTSCTRRSSRCWLCPASHTFLTM